MNPHRILLVDDDDNFRRTARCALVRAGYEVQEACNGHQALTLVRQARPDLVITDLIMPEKEGIETIVELRRSDPELPIIAISGGGRLSMEDNLLIAQKLGARSTLTKPFRSVELLEAVESVLVPAAT
jgi:CheY-like chemotaxis protein